MNMTKSLLAMLLLIVVVRAGPVQQRSSNSYGAQVIGASDLGVGSPPHNNAIEQFHKAPHHSNVAPVQIDLINRDNYLDYLQHFDLMERAVMNQKIREGLSDKLDEVKSRLRPVDVTEWSLSNLDLSRAIDHQFHVLVAIAELLDNITWDDIRSVFPSLLKDVCTDVFPEYNAVIDEGLRRAPNFEYLEQALATMLQIIRAIENSVALMDSKDISTEAQLNSLKQFYETVVSSFILEEDTYLSIYASQTLFMSEYNMCILNQMEDILKKIKDYSNLNFDVSLPSGGDTLSSYAEQLVELKSKIIPRSHLEKGQASQANIALVKKQSDAVKTVLQEVDDALEQISPYQGALQLEYQQQQSIQPTQYSPSDFLDAEVEDRPSFLENQQQQSIDSAEYLQSNELDAEVEYVTPSLQNGQSIRESQEHIQSNQLDAIEEEQEEQIVDDELPDDMHFSVEHGNHFKSPPQPIHSLASKKPIEVTNQFDILMDSDPVDEDIDEKDDLADAQLVELQSAIDAPEPFSAVTDEAKLTAQQTTGKNQFKKGKKGKKKPVVVESQPTSLKKSQIVSSDKATQEADDQQKKDIRQMDVLMLKMNEVAKIVKKSELQFKDFDLSEILRLSTHLYRTQRSAEFISAESQLSQKLYELENQLLLSIRTLDICTKMVELNEEKIQQLKSLNAQLPSRAASIKRALAQKFKDAEEIQRKILNQRTTASGYVLSHNKNTVMALQIMRREILELTFRKSQDEMVANAKRLNHIVKNYQNLVTWLLPNYNYRITEGTDSDSGDDLANLEKEITVLIKYGKAVAGILKSILDKVEQK
ncbi:hypothetical protein MIR68_005079 [Amoeboaphelidium protococcarum]|nr:hypothetical protein MIR68_005079 [Amoeboaphelidium protococcarum]